MTYIQELKKFEILKKRFKMDYKWRNQKEKLQYYMSIPPKKKLEWLWQMHEFIRLAYTKKRRNIFWKLREAR